MVTALMVEKEGRTGQRCCSVCAEVARHLLARAGRCPAAMARVVAGMRENWSELGGRERERVIECL